MDGAEDIGQVERAQAGQVPAGKDVLNPGGGDGSRNVLAVELRVVAALGHAAHVHQDRDLVLPQEVHERCGGDVAVADGVQYGSGMVACSFGSPAVPP